MGVEIEMAESAKILVVEDDEDILSACRLLLKKRFGQVTTTNTPESIPQLMAETEFDAILLDMNFAPGDYSGRDGIKWLSRILNIDPMAIVILITAYSSVDAAVEAMKRGAADFVEKPWSNEKLISTLNAAVRLRQAQAETRRLKQRTRIFSEDLSRRDHPIVGESKAINMIMDMIARTAPTDANVLILGENGTGKELVAREIHARSQRAGEVFVSVDLGAVPETLLESELFGHKKGAFTDAREDRLGRFQAAEDGTFFLDEIGNLPLSVQPKLLTALENREITPVGGVRAEPIDIRLVSATNVSPDDLKDSTVFRPDLLYRLNTVEIHVPPLRDRVSDIPLLVETFLDQYSRKYNRPVHGISNNALSLLMHYAWPGNVRELRYSIERAVILCDGDELRTRDFSSLQGSGSDSPTGYFGDMSLEQIEKTTIERVIEKHQGNISNAAKELGLTRTSLYRRIKKYEL
jgi:DNA-binding NtrC family response regulator